MKFNRALYMGWSQCSECGGLVSVQMEGKHRDWHAGVDPKKVEVSLEDRDIEVMGGTHVHPGTANVRYIVHSHDGLDYHSHQNGDDLPQRDAGVDAGVEGVAGGPQTHEDAFAGGGRTSSGGVDIEGIRAHLRRFSNDYTLFTKVRHMKIAHRWYGAELWDNAPGRYKLERAHTEEHAALGNVHD